MVMPTFMALRFTFILLLLAVALVSEASTGSGPANAGWGLTRLSDGEGGLGATKTCNGLVGDCVGEEEEMDMESETARRFLAARRRFISYGALKKDKVPCSRRGQSYYNCQRHGRANPYRRGCSIITKCARILN